MYAHLEDDLADQVSKLVLGALAQEGQVGPQVSAGELPGHSNAGEAVVQHCSNQASALQAQHDQSYG